MMWFKKSRPREIWEEPVAEPLGDIEAAQRIRAICHAAAGSAETVGKPEGRAAENQQAERERYERAAKTVMEIAMNISDELVRDAAVREIVGLCVKANNMKTARALFRAIRASSIKGEVLKEHPSLADEPG